MKRSPRYLIALALGLGLTLVLMWLLSGNLPAARAAMLCVHPTGASGCYTTIQAAVNAAASGEVISITAGTYNENVNISGKVLIFTGAGVASTIVDGGGVARVFNSDSNLTLSDLTLQHGNITGDGGGLYTSGAVTLTNVAVLSNTASGTWPNGNGGGAYAGGAATLFGSLFQNNTCTSIGSNSKGGGLYANGTLTLTGTGFLSNTADGDGGGMYAQRAATLSDGVFQNNRSSIYGGGLFALSTLTLTGMQFLSNTASGVGGGVHAFGTAMLDGGLFQNNQGSYGGGLYVFNTLTLRGTQFFSNTATYRGGGVYAWGVSTISGGVFQNNACTGSGCAGGGMCVGNTLTVTDTQFLGNTAAGDGGGGYHLNSSNGRLVNTLFVGNAASENGSALYLGSSGQVALMHTTIASPTVGAGTAIYVTGTGTVNITNTLVASYTTSIQQAGGTVSSDYNLFFHAPTSIDIGSHSLTGTNPLFVNPAGDDYHLLVGSPAAGAGLDVGVATDLDGVARGDPPAIGAYELSFVITPTWGTGGSITPGTPQTVSYGGSATFTITADSGYQIADVSVDSASVGVTTTYTFNNVMADHTLTAAFKRMYRVMLSLLLKNWP